MHDTTTFRVRALEVHSQYAWDFDWIMKAMRFVREHGLTSLILHRNDLADLVTYNAKYFGSTQAHANIFERYQEIHRKLYKLAPLHRGGPYQRRDYLRRVTDVAARWGVSVYFETKEIYFHDVFVELNPQLRKDGHLCPSEPFWAEFLGVKYGELLTDLPGIAGIICSVGTGESRLAISANRCSCELCRAMQPAEWYTRIIQAIHAPLHAAGKELAIRDFVFDRATHVQLAEAIERLPPDIIVTMKNTPHDYYPTFPDNPRLGRLGARRQWTEYDCMAQYFGWGIAPATMIEDIRRRLGVAAAAGAEGVMLRTDWEGLEAHTAFHTPNLLNLYAGAALSQDPATPARDIYRSWLREQGMLRADAPPEQVEEAASWAESVLGESWQAVRRSLYMNDCVFSDSSNYPVSLAHGWWLAEEKNSLKDWLPEKSDALGTGEANLAHILQERNEAEHIVRTMLQRVRTRPAALTEATHADLVARIETASRYITGFCAVGRACILTRAVLDDPARLHALRSRLDAALQALLLLSDEFRRFHDAEVTRPVVAMLVGWERLQLLHRDLTERLASISTEANAAA